MRWKLDLRNFFSNEARRNLIPAQKRLIETKRGVALDSAPDNAPATVKRKGGLNHWLKDTGETKRNVFQFEAGRTKLTLYASESHHKKWPTYAQLIEWHTKKYSGLFQTLPRGSAFPVRLAREVQRQAKTQIYKMFKAKFNVR